MIYTLTPNPALDLGGMVDRLVPNEKSYVSEETLFPGGNAINAARMIKKLGVPVIAGGFLGGGIGKQVEDLLEKEGVRCDFVKISGNTRVNITISNRRTHLQTRLSFHGPQVQPLETRKMSRWISRLPAKSLLVIGGSLPPGLSALDLKKFIQLALRKKIRCVVDSPGTILRDLASSKPLFIKPNLSEFQDLIGRKISSIPNIIKEAKRLTPDIPLVCISSVNSGALLVTAHGVWFGKTPRIQVKTTVGAGDSMVGAMTAQIWKAKLHLDPSKIVETGADILRWGLAASAATLVTTGTKLGDYRQILSYYPKIRIESLDLIGSRLG